jgi:two-component system cell cycle sensor histidine kinase/response regulator CckA
MRAPIPLLSPLFRDSAIPCDRFAVADTRAATPQALAPTNPSVRVLVVDDNLAIQWLIRRILDEAKGYTVVTACDGAAALRAADSAMTDEGRTIHLVLTDLDMPGIDGRELGRQLAARWPTLPVVYMSGTTIGLRLRARLSAHEHFLAKPFSAETLLRKLGLVLGLAAQVCPPTAEEASPHDSGT